MSPLILFLFFRAFSHRVLPVLRGLTRSWDIGGQEETPSAEHHQPNVNYPQRGVSKLWRNRTVAGLVDGKVDALAALAATLGIITISIKMGIPSRISNLI